MLQFPSLSERIYKSRHQCYRDACQPTISVCRPAKFKQWSEEVMVKAVNAVLNDGMSVRRAAIDYDIPKSTLGDRVSGRVIPGSTSGPKKLLTEEEEGELVAFVRRCATIGYPKSRKDLMSLVQKIMEIKGIQHQISNGWWMAFCKRHPNLTLRAPVALSQARAVATDGEVMDNYFDLLEKTMIEYDLLGKPGQVFNMDESGFPLNPKSPKGIFEVGTQNAAAVTSGNKAQITVLACVSAAGHCLPPMVIFDREKFPMELANGEIPGTIYGFSSNGWIDQGLFEKWFTNHFLRYVPSVRPLLLLMDGHSSHYHPYTIQKAAEEEVILFALPPNTTHITQPLDKGCFGPLKAKWAEVCHEYITDYPGKVVNRFCFSRLLHKAWIAMSASNIIAGFRTTGVYPISRNALKSVKTKEPASKEHSKLKFLPLCNPSPRALEISKKIHTFTQAQLEKFEKRFEAENGGPDEQYQQWLDTYHPSHTSLSGKSTEETITLSTTKTVMIPVPNSSVACEKVLSNQDPSVQMPAVKVKSFGRVLTSTENLKIIEEKLQKKQKEEELKAERKQLKEEKRRMKQASTTLKKSCNKVKASEVDQSGKCTK